MLVSNQGAAHTLDVSRRCSVPVSARLALLLLGASSLCRAATPEAGALPQTEPYVCQTWRVEDGLPHDSVRAISQTRDGYLWIGTGGGVARFDGVRFTLFGLGDGLPALYVRTLLADSKGRLWVGTDNGLARFEDGRFRSWTTRDELLSDSIFDLVEDREGAIWIGTNKGLNRWRDGHLSVPDATISSARVAVDGSGAVWALGPTGSLLRWSDGRFAPFSKPSAIQNLRPNWFTRDAVGRLWLTARGSVFCLQGSTWLQYGPAEGLPDVAMFCLGAGADGTVWVGSFDQGLYELRPGEERFHAVRCTNRALDPAVRVVFEDRDKNLWVGTRSSGLSLLRQAQVTTWQIKEGDTDVMPFSLAAATDGSLIVGTAGRGLYRLTDGLPAPFLREELEAYGLRTDVVPLGNAVARAECFVTREGALWFVAGSRLFQYRDGRLRRLPAIGGVASLCQDREGAVWIGGPNGNLRRFHRNEQQDFSDKLPQTLLTALAPNPDGSLWIGAYAKGVFRFQAGKASPPRKLEGLRSDLIRTLYCDKEGVLWIGTEGGGLSRFEAGHPMSFGKAEGLPDDSILQILEDDAGHLWLASYKGIMCVTRRELAEVVSGRSPRLHPRVFGHTEGMRSEQCMSSFGGAVKLRDGRLCFATISGVVAIDPRQAAEPPPPPRLRLECVLADDQPVPLSANWLAAADQQTLGPTNLTVPPGPQRFEFHYIGLFLAAPEKVRYRHRLIGLEPGWVEGGETRAAYYSHLPPGRYRFEVSAHSGNGIWSDPPVSLNLVLQPFFWQTSWFMGLCGLALIALTIAVIRSFERRRVRARLQQLELEHAMERERTRIARNIHDDLGSRLTQISMLTDLARRDAPPEHAVARHVRNIASAAREMLSRLDETVWLVNPRNDQLDSLAEYLLHYAEDFFQHSKIRCHFKVSEDIPPLPVAAEPRHHVFLGAKEALNNIVRHAGASEVRLDVAFAAGRFSLKIHDNGRGFDVAECVARGRGLENMRSRVENLGGLFELQSRPGEGTTVRMEFDVAAALQPKSSAPPATH